MTAWPYQQALADNTLLHLLGCMVCKNVLLTQWQDWRKQPGQQCAGGLWYQDKSEAGQVT